MTSSEPGEGGLSADAVAAQSFAVVRRGYDTREVQAFLRQLSDELRGLRRSLADHQAQLAEARAAAEEASAFDEQRLTEALGAETVRILDAARSAADDLRARGRADGDALLAAASTDADRIRSEAASVLEQRRAEADAEVAERLAEAARTLEQARTDADGVRRQAADDAATAVEEARLEGRAMVAEAHQVRERMLRDLTKRRKALRAQIEQLQVGRDRLLEAYEVVRTTLHHATGELEVALPEARSAAAAVSARVSVEPEGDDERIDPDLLAELSDGGVAPPAPAPAVGPVARGEDAPPVDDSESVGAEDGSAATEEADRNEAAAAPGDADAAGALDDGDPAAEHRPDDPSAARDIGSPGAADAAEEPPAAGSADGGAPESAVDEGEASVDADADQPGQVATDAGGASDGPGEAVSEEASPGQATTEHAGEGSIFSRPAPRRAPDPVEHTGRFSSAVTVLAPDAEPDDTPEATAPTAPPPRGSGSDSADPASIFARLRAETDQPTGSDGDPDADEDVAVEADGADPGEVEAATGAGPEADDEADATEVDEAASGEHSDADADPSDADASEVDDATEVDETASGEHPDADADADADPSEAGAPAAASSGDEASGDEASGDEASGDEAAGEDAVIESVPEVVLRRDEALADVRATLARRLKRTLADEQNEVLEVLRRRRGKVDLAQLVVDHDAHVGRYADASLPALASAAAAGGDQIRNRHPELVEDVPRTRVGDVAADLAIEVVVPLRRRVEEAIVANPGDETAIGDAVRVAYRDVKQRLVDDAAALACARVFCRAHAQPVRSGTPMVWLAVTGGPRSAGCQANAEAAPVPHGEAFPDPSVTPPCSAGCRCMVVPAVEVAVTAG